MAAFFVSQARIKDPEKMAEYGRRAGETIGPEPNWITQFCLTGKGKMPANATKDRFIPIRGAFAPQVGLSCQTHMGAADFRSEYAGMA